METDAAVRRAQAYRFLADVFVYPHDNWLEDWPLFLVVARAIDPRLAGGWPAEMGALSLAELQAEHRRCFGLAGSLCYETELGLPHEFRQSQELADLAGFYQAFGFRVGGPVRERPDHLAVELEFMHLLALKEAASIEGGMAEHSEVCASAQAKFLNEHLGQWLGAFAQSLAATAAGGPYCAAAAVAAEFVAADAARLGVTPEPRRLKGAKPTPLPPADMTCAGCAVAERA